MMKDNRTTIDDVKKRKNGYNIALERLIYTNLH